MRALLLGAVTWALVVGSVAAAPDVVCAPPRRAFIPGTVETVTRERYVPPCLSERNVPVYEVTQEPVYGCRIVPRYGAVHVDAPRYREEPVYETRKTPVCVQAAELVYATRCKPIMAIDLTSWCEERTAPTYSIVERVPCGVRYVPKVVGYKEERVQVGTVRVPCGEELRVEKRLLGYEQERFMVGTREVRRIVGWKKETVVVTPARVETVTDRIPRPGRWVTVCDDPAAPLLASTSERLTEAQFAAASAPR
jgi:hypothetical protein